MIVAERNKKKLPTTCFRLVLLRKYENTSVKKFFMILAALCQILLRSCKRTFFTAETKRKRLPGIAVNKLLTDNSACIQAN